MNREELKATVKKAYGKGYYKGYYDACDAIIPAIQMAMIDLAADMKKFVKESEVQAINELEDVE